MLAEVHVDQGMHVSTSRLCTCVIKLDRVLIFYQVDVYSVLPISRGGSVISSSSNMVSVRRDDLFSTLTLWEHVLALVRAVVS